MPELLAELGTSFVHGPQAVKRMEQARLDRPDGAAQRRGDAVEGMVDVEPKVDHLAMLGWESFNTVAEKRGTLGPVNRLVRP